MTIDKTKVGYIIMAWAFFQGLIGAGVNLPTFLMALGTIVYLLPS